MTILFNLTTFCHYGNPNIQTGGTPSTSAENTSMCVWTHIPVTLRIIRYILAIYDVWLRYNRQSAFSSYALFSWRSHILIHGEHEVPSSTSASNDDVISRGLSESFSGFDRSGPVSFGILFSFFHFIRRFWNQIFIWRSVRPNMWAISIRRRRVRYLL